MGTNAPLTTDSVTQPLNRAGDFEEDFTIHSIFFAKCSAAAGAELPATFSKRSSAAFPDTEKIDNVVPTCVTTCRSRWKKPPSARRKKSKFENSTPATSARARARNQVLAASIARSAAVAAK